jgi:hypothetical protein
MEIGKLVTAHLLIQKENHDRLFSFDSNWLRILYNRIAGEYDDIAKNQIGFITFNYDRNIEHFFFNAISKSYDKPPAEVKELLDRHIPIIHLHGRLGFLPWQGESPSESRDFEPYPTKEAVETGARNIKIIHEDITDGRDKDFAQAKALLARAEKIVFMGFGYNARNIERLGIVDLADGKAIGTCQGLGSLGETLAHQATRNKIKLKSGDCTHFVTEELTWA